MAEPSGTTSGTSGTAAAAQPAADLDELMMAMDVVDTLRHDRRMLERELGQDDRDEALKQRLRELYEGQGLAVTEAILDEGIAALRESRFSYEPPQPSLAVTLARLWVSRMRWGPWAGGAAALLVGWLLWSALAPSEEARLAADLEAAAQKAAALADDATAESRLAELRRRTEAALAAGRLDEAEAGIAEFGRLADRLAAVYDIRIVSRPGTLTGLWREPDVNSSARNYYIVVEAVAPDGAVLARPVANEETGRTETVKLWAKRVPKATFDRVAADKTDDGIVQESLLGSKRAGRLAPDWAMPVEPGAITSWEK
ncbi:hypothetical protein LNKW23_47980 [Paralimibaculum aggregatum]|uniref:Anti-sigma factor n=1 Tax=Paralimibaculum aggregatum TaxID=3036245 RepID=A0ABQ6LU25_9RHOB|nr:DUF6384 family protein [Limibaculum sp. NKW23]GMG85575.1 hypothetical protein LNKW23_47980 [Limibaculum sp. NKW23]